VSHTGVTNAHEPAYAPPPPARGKDLVPVFVIVGVRTTGGPGPGVKHLPRAEAGRLVSARIAVHGTSPPPNWSGPG
jgi:hypothetical protein